MTDKEFLQRYIKAQDPVMHQVWEELAAGRKKTHWMWYVFPTWQGLGQSERSWYYGFETLEQVVEYEKHPMLRRRLITSVEMLLTHPHMGIREMLGDVDAVKFKSCMELFGFVSPKPWLYREALRIFYSA